MNDQLQQGHEGGRTPAGGGSAAKPTSATKATAQGYVSHCTMYHTARAPRKRLFRHISPHTSRISCTVLPRIY